MERLRGSINSLVLAEGMSSECLEAGDTGTSSALDVGHDPLMSHHRVPFLQMLRGAMQAGLKEEDGQQIEEEEQPRLHLQYPETFFSPYPEESHSQLLRRLQLQHSRQQTVEMECSRAIVEAVDSCVTHASTPNPVEATAMPRERRKRKRARANTAASKNAEEAESQRMTHIVVERNRRRLMNHHLAALRDIMPPCFVQRGDQASIVGGAIEFVKELEQLLLSLQAEKVSRAATNVASASSCSSSASSPCTALSRSNEEEASNVATSSPLEGIFVAPQYTSYSQSGEEWGVDVEAMVVQGHVSLKVAGRRRPGQIARAVAALEELRLPVLHLTVTSVGTSAVLYSLNLKMEEDCKLGSPEEIATAVHQIFAYINAS